MRRLAVASLCSLGLWASAACAGEFFLKPGATDLSVASSYTTEAGGSVDCGAAPGSADTIVLPADSTCSVDSASASFATLAGCARIRPEKGATLEVTVADGTARLVAPFYAAAEDSVKRTYGTLVKKGDGTLVLGPSTAITSSTPAASYLYSVNVDVRAGTLRYPENITVNGYGGNFTAADGTTVFMPKSPGSASQFYFNHICTAAGSLLTNDTTRGMASGHVIGVTPYAGCKTVEDSEIAGRVAGGIRIWTTGNLILSGTDNTVLSCVTANGGSYGYHTPGGKGTILVKTFGSVAGAPSSLGCGTTMMVYTSGGGFRYLGEGEATSRDFQLYTGKLIGFLDAGPVGKLLFAGRLRPEHDASCTPYVRMFHFTGSNRNESVWSGSCGRLVTGGVTYPLHITKSGSGIWRFAENRDRYHLGGLTVADGVLRFDSIAERGLMCSLGTAALPTVNAYDAVTADRTQLVDYAFTLGGKTAEGATADPVMEYSGSDSATCSTRPIVLAEGGGRLRNNSSVARFAFFGISARDVGTNPTLTLDGDGAAVNTAGDITNGLGTVSVVKRGTGKWTLTRDLTFSGDLEVKEGTLEVANVSTNYTWFRYTICQLGKSYGKDHTTVHMRELALYDATGTRQNIGLTPVYPEPYPYVDEKTLGPALDAALDLQPGEVSYTRCPDEARTLRSYVHQNPDLTKFIDLDGYFSGEGKTMPGMAHKYYVNFDIAPKVDDPSTWIPIVMRLRDDVPPITHFDLQVMSNYNSCNNWPNYVIWEGSVDGLHWDVIFDNRGTEKGFELDRTYVDKNGALCGLGASTSTYTTYVCNLWMSDMMPHTNNATMKRPYPASGYAFSATGIDRKFSQLQNVRSISVAEGATLKVSGERLPLSSLKVDVSGAGTLDGFAFGETGTIDVTGAGNAADVALPGSFANCTGLENVENWAVKLDGVVRTGRMVVCRNGELHLVKRGLLLIVR